MKDLEEQLAIMRAMDAKWTDATRLVESAQAGNGGRFPFGSHAHQELELAYINAIKAAARLSMLTAAAVVELSKTKA